MMQPSKLFLNRCCGSFEKFLLALAGHGGKYVLRERKILRIKFM